MSNCFYCNEHGEYACHQLHYDIIEKLEAELETYKSSIKVCRGYRISIAQLGWRDMWKAIMTENEDTWWDVYKSYTNLISKRQED
jgi:NRPS condensation-like uncharacterized protein